MCNNIMSIFKRVIFIIYFILYFLFLVTNFLLRRSTITHGMNIFSTSITLFLSLNKYPPLSSILFCLSSTLTSDSIFILFKLFFSFLSSLCKTQSFFIGIRLLPKCFLSFCNFLDKFFKGHRFHLPTRLKWL